MKIIYLSAWLLITFSAIAAEENKDVFIKKKFVNGKVVFECEAKWVQKDGLTVGVCIEEEKEKVFDEKR